MLPGAQIAATIEILETLEGFWNADKAIPVDGLLADYFRKRRYIGAKDKGFISRRVYGVLRRGASLQWWAEQAELKIEPRSMVLAYIAIVEELTSEVIESYFSGTGHCAAKLDQKEKAFINHFKDMDASQMPEWMRLDLPEWMLNRFKELFGDDLETEIAALNVEAPFDLRVNTLKTTREKAIKQLKEEGFNASPTPYSPIGLRLEKRGALFATKIFKDGWVEVQDEGSQLCALLADAQPGMKIIDFCAGAGGKTLALAAQMQNKGRIYAWDVSEKRLEQAPKRFRRAGVDNAQKQVISSESDSYIKRHKASADRVVVDAPCTGAGTFRRNPDLKWRMQPSDLEEVTAIQKRILASAARLVKNGGRLVYITCSLLREENEDQIKQFLTDFPDFTLVSPAKIWNNETEKLREFSHDFLRLTPHQTGTDGFFAAVLEKTG